MQVKCIRPFGLLVPGDLAEVPDGAAVDPHHWAVATEADIKAAEEAKTPQTPPEPSSPTAPAVFPAASAVTPKEF